VHIHCRPAEVRKTKTRENLMKETFGEKQLYGRKYSTENRTEKLNQ